MDEIRNWLIVMTAVSILPLGYIYYVMLRRVVEWIRCQIWKRGLSADVEKRLEAYTGGVEC